MHMKPLWPAVLVLAALCLSTARGAEGVDAALQARIDAKVKEIEGWAKEAAVVEATKAQNANTPAEYTAMTQEKWKGLSKLDPFVRSFSKNAAGQALKAKQDETVAEAFVSDAKGLKVAFLAKPSNWCHAGKPKHDEPMQGKSWQGSIEVDESSGVQQIQVAVPVLDGEKPVGSLVVGLVIAKLK